MIRSLRVRNWGRIEEADLVFDETDRIIVVSGPNGAGKTSLLHALTTALAVTSRTGQSFHGRITWGAEAEGAELDCTFTVPGRPDLYRVIHQIRGAGKNQSWLTCGDRTLATGVQPVTRALHDLYRMRYQLLEAATVIAQGELPLLTTASPTQRKALLSALLQLDRVEQAAHTARRDAHARIQELRELEAPEPGLLTKTRRRRDEARRNLRTWGKELRSLRARLEQARSREMRLVGQVEQLQAWLSEYQELQRLQVPRDDEQVRDRLREAQAELQRVRATDERILALSQRHQSLVVQLERVEQQLGKVPELLRGPDPAGEVARLEQEVYLKKAELQKLEQRGRDLDVRAARLDEELAGCREQIRRAENLTGTCPHCGQPVTETYRARHVAELQDRVRELEQAAGALDPERAALSAEITRATQDVEEVASRWSFHRAWLQPLRELTETRDRLVLERDQTRQDLEQAADSGDLRRRAARLEQEIRDLHAAEQAANTWRSAQQRLRQLHEQLGEYPNRRLAALRDELQAGRDEQVELGRQAEELEQRIQRAGNTVQELELEVRRLAQAQHTYQTQARRAQYAGKLRDVLAAVHDQLTWIAKPVLSGAVSTWLQSLSDGAFRGVRFLEGFELRVLTSTQRSLEPRQLSGGEQDLVGLAIRLGVRSVLRSFYGSEGPGIMLLDECFGSQDPGRRQTMLRALESLRQTPDLQLWLVSHVGGIEAVADREIRLRPVPGEEISDLEVR